MRRPKLQREIIQAIRAGPFAWSYLTELVSSLSHHHPNSIRRAIRKMCDQRILDPWTIAKDKAVTLSPETAEQLGVEIAEFGYGEAPRFVDEGVEGDPPRVPPDAWGMVSLPANLPDPAPPVPDQVAELLDNPVAGDEPPTPYLGTLMGFPVERLKPRPRSTKRNRR